MRWLALLALIGCVADDAAPPDSYDADPGDFDSKADGVSSTSPAVLSFIDGASTRLYAQVPTLADKTLVQHLTAAANRGVDVHIYAAVAHPARPATVLAVGQLEAAGVDTVIERKTRLAGFLAIADDQQLVRTGSTYKPTTDGVADAAATFTQVTAEDTSGLLPSLGTDTTQVFAMPESHVGPIVRLLETATQTIDIEIYQIESPAIVAALGAAVQRGVTVRVMLEPRTVGFANYTAVKAQLAKLGVTVKDTPPAFDSHHNVDHAKFLLIDDRDLVFGSGNLVRSGLGGIPATEFDNRDFWVRDRRAASLSEARTVFDADWSRTSTASKSFTNLVLTPDNADAAILDLVAHATTRLYVYNQSLSDADVIAALVAAKQRGVDVRVLLGMQPGFSGSPPANQPAIDQLTAAGASAQFLTLHYLHAKAIVADDRVFIGSQNFTHGGLGMNRELGEILDAPAVVDALATLFTADATHPAP